MRQSRKEQAVERAALDMLTAERREALTGPAAEASGDPARASVWPGGHPARRGEPPAGL